MNSRLKLPACVAVVLFVGVLAVFALPRCLDHLWGNVPITFYGCVVDTDGRPVADARIVFVVSAERRLQLPLLWSSGQIQHVGTTITDQQGRFAVEGMNGRFLTIRAVEKAGYQLLGSGGGNYCFDSGVGAPLYVPDAQHPVTIDIKKG